MGFYERLGVRPIINATCHWTAYGGSVMWPEVLEAMADARRTCVDMHRLLDRAGEFISRYTHAEASHVVSGCAAGLQVGAKLLSGPTAPADLGNSLPLRTVPVGLPIHNIELTPGHGAQMVRTAGGSATLMSRDEGYAQIRLPSGEIRRINENCYATIGQVGNAEHENVVLGKAGRSRHLGIRPINRGVSRNPVDHPNGGGAGKSKSGGGWQQLTSPWGLLAKGYRTRNKKKSSNRFILVRRDGRPMTNV